MNKEKNVGVSPLLGTPYAKLGFMLKDGSVTIKKLAAEVLNLIYSSGGGQGGGIVQLVDLSDRMTADNDTVTDMEIKTSLFLYDAYNRVSAIARVVEPESNIPYALFKVSYYDNVEDKDKITYFAYTTEDDMHEGATWHFNRAIEADDSLYPWAMNVFGDALVDVENDLLILGSNKYQLERYKDDPIISYTYGIPDVELTYPSVSADGETVYPTVSFTQAVTKAISYGSTSDTETYTLTGTITFEGTSYSDKSLVVNEAAVTFSGNNPYQSGGVDTIGKIIATASDVASARLIRNVTVVLSVNGKTNEDSAEVWQSAASIESSKRVTGISADGGDKTIKFTKTVGVDVNIEDIDISESDNWITIDGVTTSTDGKSVTIGYSIAKNTGGGRTGTVSIGTSVVGLSTGFTVEQNAVGAYLEVIGAQASGSGYTLSFGKVYSGESNSKDIYVKGSNLGTDVTVTISDGDFYIVKSAKELVQRITIPKESVMSADGAKVTLRYVAGAVGSASSTLYLTYGASASTTTRLSVALSGESVPKTSESYVGYYGVEEQRNDTPQINSANSFSLSSNNNTYEVTLSDVGRKAWVAVPVEIADATTITGVDALGFPLNLDSTVIGDYKYYYRSALGTFFGTKFTVTYNG